MQNVCQCALAFATCIWLQFPLCPLRFYARYWYGLFLRILVRLIRGSAGHEAGREYEVRAARSAWEGAANYPPNSPYSHLPIFVVYRLHVARLCQEIAGVLQATHLFLLRGGSQ